MDGYNNYSTMHVVIDKKNNVFEIKNKIREEMLEHGIVHTTIEVEEENECNEHECNIDLEVKYECHHHHH